MLCYKAPHYYSDNSEQRRTMMRKENECWNVYYIDRAPEILWSRSRTADAHTLGAHEWLIYNERREVIETVTLLTRAWSD